MNCLALTSPLTARPSAAFACLSLLAALTGCGDDGGDDASPDVALLEGDWQFQRCNTADGQAERGLLRVVRQDGMRFTLHSGSVRYANSDCTGSATVRISPPEQAAQFVARRTGSTASLAIFWANWTYEAAASGPSSRWVRKGDFLCQSYYASLAAASPDPDNPYDLERITRETDEAVQNGYCHLRKS